MSDRPDAQQGVGGNRIACHRCDDPITEWCETRRFGFWDPETQNYESNPPTERRFCRECWNDNEGRQEGAHFWPETAQELYDVLDAADGKLAGILCWWSGRPAIRVVDGEVEAAGTKPTDGGTKDDGTPILRFVPTAIDDFDMERFYEDADPPEEMNLVRLLDPERTAFGALDQEVVGMSLELTDRQRQRLDSIKAECKDADPGLPEPTDEMVLDSLLDTWDAVNEGLYSDCTPPQEGQPGDSA